jgi:tRNA pseudouridine55 synthase
MSGLLLINKPQGMTSFGVVAKVKRLTGERHVGHTGTLDPMATGVLPVFTGRATKLCDFMLCADKSYTAGIRLGVVTDTLDITGKVISRADVSVSVREIDGVLAGFLGDGKQTPPMFSAIKKDGVRLYRLAREGKTADVPARDITVFSLVRESEPDENGEFTVSCSVSKGTYIRSLVRDIGEKLGCGATLSALVRTKTAGFGIEQCVPLDTLTAENINDYILPADTAVSGFPRVFVTAPQAFRFSNGGALCLDRLPRVDFADGEIIRVYSKDLFIGLGAVSLCENELKFKCLINPSKEVS